ncbi:MAG: hypothetical protein LBH75_05920, partial [Treponema sp.]|nr:hypothetical protein [Treponema sp.]
DLVVFTAIPFDVYYYEVLKSPPGEDAQPGSIMSISVPRKPQPCHMPLTNYNAGVAEEHKITVNQELGNPRSYFTPAQRDQQKSQANGQGLFSTVTYMTAGQGTGSSTINIEKVKGTEDNFEFNLETEISGKIKVGGATIGGSAGFQYGYESTSSVSDGTFIEGTVPAIPWDNYDTTIDFRWGLMAYPKKDSTQSYILVTYWTELTN